MKGEKFLQKGFVNEAGNLAFFKFKYQVVDRTSIERPSAQFVRGTSVYLLFFIT
jgi:hypothetical protein